MYRIIGKSTTRKRSRRLVVVYKSTPDIKHLLRESGLDRVWQQWLLCFVNRSECTRNSWLDKQTPVTTGLGYTSKPGQRRVSKPRIIVERATMPSSENQVTVTIAKTEYAF